jgi:hypothetical protein
MLVNTNAKYATVNGRSHTDTAMTSPLLETKLYVPRRPVVEIGPLGVWVPRALTVARIRSD